MNFHIVKYLFYLLKICAKLEMFIIPISMIRNGTIKMEFIGRKTELARLKEINDYAQQSGYLTMITGRRRVGKYIASNPIPFKFSLFIKIKQVKKIIN